MNQCAAADFGASRQKSSPFHWDVRERNKEMRQEIGWKKT